MKKIISLALAASMVAGMGVTAFAAATDVAKDPSVSAGSGIYYKSKDTNAYGSNSVYVPFAGSLVGGLEDADELAANGDFAIELNMGTTKESDLKRYNAYANWTIGEKYIDGKPEIKEVKYFTNFNFKKGYNSTTAVDVKKNDTATVSVNLVAPATMNATELKAALANATGIAALTGTEKETAVNNAFACYAAQYDYSYFVTFSITDNDTYHGDVDIRGKVTVAKTPTSARDNYDKGNTHYADVNFSGVNTNAEDYIDFDGEIMDLEFDGSLFIVDTIGKDLGDMVTWNDTDYNKEIGNKYPAAELAFFSWADSKDTTFNRTGTLYFFTDDNAITKESKVYEILEDGSLKLVESKYDEDYEALTIKTRKLGKYVVSNIELALEEAPTTDAPTDEKPSTDDTTAKPNPPTGR